MITGLAFISDGAAPDYGGLLSRLRWRRAIAASREATVRPEDPAGEAFASAEVWTLVRESAAIPIPGLRIPSLGARLPEAARRYGPAAASDPPAHTLRELEGSDLAPAGAPPGSSEAPPAIVFRVVDSPPGARERVGAFFDRLAAEAAASSGEEARFGAVVVEDPSERPRPELMARIPAGRLRLVDVGCGSGATSEALRRRDEGLVTTGLERDEKAAARARPRLDRVLVGDAAALLCGLAAAGERFDAFLLGDVLEHVSDPVALLTAARALATDDAILVASVPNVGHLSLVRDLVLGRFDPVPAGLADAGHLRWFTKRFLAETLEEAGWSVHTIEGLPGAAPADAATFVAALGDWPELDFASLSTYQWLAVASALPGAD